MLAEAIASGEAADEAADNIAAGLVNVGGPGLFAGLFAQGLVTGELEYREQLKDERRELRDQEGQDS